MDGRIDDLECCNLLKFMGRERAKSKQTKMGKNKCVKMWRSEFACTATCAQDRSVDRGRRGFHMLYGQIDLGDATKEEKCLVPSSGRN